VCPFPGPPVRIRSNAAACCGHVPAMAVSSLPNPLNHPFTAQAGHDLCVEVKARADGGNPLLVLRLSLAVRSPTRELLNFGSIRKLVG
jgi:hypothetical protein